MEPNLTNNIEKAYRLSLEVEDKMKGTVRPTSRYSRCPDCGKKFAHYKKVGYFCIEHNRKPERLYVDLYWKGERIKLFSDKMGMPLETYDRAHSILSKIRNEIDNHEFDPTKYVAGDIKKFWASALLDKFLSEKIDSIAPAYKKDYKRYVEAEKEYFKNMDVRDIRKSDLKGYKNFIERGYKPQSKKTIPEKRLSETNPKDEKTIKRKGKTVKNYIDHFKVVMNWLKDDVELIDKIPLFPDVEVEKFDWQWIEAETQMLVLEKVPEEDRPILVFLMLHGCRPGEARALLAKRIDISKGTIKIIDTFSGKEIRSKRKGKKSEPLSIPIHPEMYDYLAEKVSNNLTESFIFPNPRTGKPYSMSAIGRLWDSTRETAGISKDLRLYDATRHSFASQLGNKDTSILAIKDLLGHTSIKTTEKYTHNKLDKLRTDMEKLSLKGKKAEILKINRPQKGI